jgi:hypothetical protein
VLQRFIFANLSERKLAGMRALSLSKGKSSGPIAGAERLGEVVARKALRRAGDSEKRERERERGPKLV